jgi:lysophospholipase L1-like esterase
MRSHYLLVTALLLSLTSAASARGTEHERWNASWAAVPDSAGPALKDRTIRQVVRTTVAGSKIRIRLSNLYGEAPVTIGPVHLAMHAAGARIRAGTDHRLTFAGQPAVTIPAGASVLSDPVEMAVPALTDLAVSLYLPGEVAVSSVHGTGMQTAFILPGNSGAALDLATAKRDDSRYFLTDVEVVPDRPAQTLVVLGDSIADGVGSGNDRNARWPDLLAARLQANPAFASIAVINAGIAGNRLLSDAVEPFVGPSALSRFQRDALDKPGVRWILLHEGINDIATATLLRRPQDQVTAAQVIEGMRTLATRARAQGIRIGVGTLLPYEGTKQFHSEAAEAERQAVNAWIRTSGTFDAVIDFDLALRDPAHPGRLRPAFDSGDHLHPNEAGYRLMAETIDLHMLEI